MDDRTNAQALILAKAHLEKLGWKYGPDDIGECAARIVTEMERHLKVYRDEQEPSDG